MEPNLLAVGVLTSAGVVVLSIRLGWLRKVATRVAVAVWITVVVMIACLPLCEELPGGFMLAFASGLACALPATWIYHRAALEWHGYPAEQSPAARPRATQATQAMNWTPAQEVMAAKLQAGMGRKVAWVVEEL